MHASFEGMASASMEPPASAKSSRSRTVAFLVSHSSAGGAQEIWANLAEGFRERGYPTRLMALYPYRDAVRETSKELPWRYVVPARPTSPSAQIAMMRALVALFRAAPPDVLFTAMPAANVLAPIAARVAGAPTRIAISHHSPVGTYSRALNLVDGLTGSLGNVQTIISVSNAVGDSLAGKPAAYQAKRRTIHNALPPGVEAPLRRLRRDPGEDRRGRKVVATGRLAAQKNYPALLKAAARLPDVIFTIIGSGPDEKELKDLSTALGVADRVTFLGQRPRDEVVRLLAESDVFVQPSLFEGHSLGLLEAAQLGLPIVVSNVPSQIEGVTGTDGALCGLTVDPHDDEGLAREIKGLLDDPEARRRWSVRSSALAEGATFERMMAAYESLLN